MTLSTFVINKRAKALHPKSVNTHERIVLTLTRKCADTLSKADFKSMKPTAIYMLASLMEDYI